MRFIVAVGFALLVGLVAYFFGSENIAHELVRDSSFGKLVINITLLSVFCSYVGMLLVPKYTKDLAERGSNKALRIIDEIEKNYIYVLALGAVFYLFWNVGLRAFINTLPLWNAIVSFFLALILIVWISNLVSVLRICLDAVRALSISENRKGE